MIRKKQSIEFKRRKQRRRQRKQRPPISLENKTVLKELLNGVVLESESFAKDEFHGDTKWIPEQLAAAALNWSWQETKNVTDAFDQTLEPV